jgi:hypothetical protein
LQVHVDRSIGAALGDEIAAREAIAAITHKFNRVPVM